MGKDQLIHWMEEQEEKFSNIALKIWENPELAYEETFSSKLLSDALKEAGFKVEHNIGGAPTAFTAEYGEGKPIIGIIGEFDALPGLSQRVNANRDPIDPGGPGHGCGHNLLGTAGVEAAIALKQRMNAENLTGTLRYYGCPAEEILSGKTFMARAGVFDDLDCAFSWHPYMHNMSSQMDYLACAAIEFHFTGKSAHASGAPHLGRSALDSVEIMNVGANYLREHVTDDIRIHYQITDGGMSPNTVPEHASVYYFVRGETKDKVNEVTRRLINVAKGAAMINETEVKWDLKASIYDVLGNKTLNRLMYEQSKLLEPLTFNEEEKKFAKELYLTNNDEPLEESPIDGSFYHDEDERIAVNASTDIGDVSYLAPLGKIMVTCMPLGVQLHSWQATAAFGSSIGLKGMHYAAKLMALSAYDLLKDKGGAVLEKAKAEFNEKAKDVVYEPGLAPDANPPVPQT